MDDLQIVTNLLAAMAPDSTKRTDKHFRELIFKQKYQLEKGNGARVAWLSSIMGCKDVGFCKAQLEDMESDYGKLSNPSKLLEDQRKDVKTRLEERIKLLLDKIRRKEEKKKQREEER